MGAAPHDPTDSPAAGPRSHASERFATAVLLAGAALLALPLWTQPYIIAQDLAAHTEMACQLRHLYGGDPAFSSVLLVHPQPWANSLPVVALAGLQTLWPSFAATKVLLTLGVVAWPLALLALCRRLHQSAWLAVVALPTAFDLAFSYGFLQFTLAKPLLPLLVARAVALAQARRGVDHALVGLQLAFLLVVTFTMHSLVFVLGLFAAGLTLALMATGAARLTRQWPLLVAAAATVPFFRATLGTGPPGTTQFASLRDALAHGWENLGDVSPGSADALAYAAAAVLASVIAAVGLRARQRPHTLLAILAAVLVLAALNGPVVLPQVSVVAPRLTALGVAFLLLALPLTAAAPVPRALTRSVATVMLAVLALFSLQLAQHWRAFSRDEMGDFEELVARVPAGVRVGTRIPSPFSVHGPHNALWHWPKLACLKSGSFTDDSFAYRATAFVELTPQARARGFMVKNASRVDDAALDAFGALLVHGDVAEAARTQALGKGRLRPLGSTGTWHLFAVEKR